MEVQKMSCASCGAPIQVPPDLDAFNCSYCGAALVVKRGEGYVALKIAEEVSQKIQDVGDQTQATIREGAEGTQEELKKLQLNQDLSAAQVQLSNIQAELRALERGKKNRKIKRQIRDLRKHEKQLISRINSLNRALQSHGHGHPPQAPTPTKKKTKTWSGCIVGFLVFFVVSMVCVGIAMPIEGSDAGGSGILSTIGTAIGLFAGITAFILVAYPNSTISRQLKDIFRKKRATTEKLDDKESE